ncbi:hypothetical protein L3Q82_019889, partial [Scortum barcoo]
VASLSAQLASLQAPAAPTDQRNQPETGDDQQRDLQAVPPEPFSGPARSVADYTLEFRTLAAEVDWTEDALCHNRLQMGSARRRVSAVPLQFPPRFLIPPGPPPNSASRAPESPSVPTPEEPMQVGGAHLSPEERNLAGSERALIDSGAEENFIDEQAAEQAGIPSEPLERPRNALAVDGRILAQVTHRTLPVKLVLSGNHVESIQLLVISSPATPLIIGLLYPPTGEAPTPHSPLIEPVDLSGVPPAYHDLQEVFNKDKALSLPPHRPYDCAIELLPDAPLPSSRLYNLTRPEQEAMEGYTLTIPWLLASSAPQHLQ